MGLIHKKIIAVMALFATSYTFSQFSHGFVQDNYSGVYGVVSNPANVVDSRYRFNVNIGSFNSLLSSDYQTPKLGNLDLFNTGFKIGLFDGPLRAGANLENNETLTNLDFLLPGSFMLNINEKHAVALLVRGRSFSNYNNFNGPLWQGLSNGFFAQENFAFDNQNLDSTSHYWSEIGINYGTVLLDGENHFLKVGGTFKFLLGLGAEQISSPTRGLQGQYNAAGENSTINLNGDLEYIRTFTPNTETQSLGIGDRLNSAASGIGADLGFVYEYRTRKTSRVGIGKNALASNKYQLKLAVSLLDVGKIDYGTVPIRTFSMNSTNITATDAANNFFGALNTAMAEIDDDPRAGSLEIALPTSLQVNLDYLLHSSRAGGSFYLNGSFNQTLIEKALPFNNNRLNIYSATVRYEMKSFSLYLPVSYSELSSINVGFGAKMGPVTIGSASFVNFFTGEGNLNNLYVGVNIPAYQDRNQFYRKRAGYHKKRRKHKRWSKGRRR